MRMAFGSRDRGRRSRTARKPRRAPLPRLVARFARSLRSLAQCLAGETRFARLAASHSLPAVARGNVAGVRGARRPFQSPPPAVPRDEAEIGR
jgi:hypothetical protein